MESGSFMEFHTREDAGQPAAFQESFAHVEMAEELGLDAVWLAESHFSPARSVLSAPLILGAAIAGRTQRIKVGTAVHVLPLGKPAADGGGGGNPGPCPPEGGLNLGSARSGLPGSYEGYNIPYSESRERFFEYLDIILKAWTNERFSYDGDYFSFDDVCLVPKPYRAPHPPIRIAANTAETFPVAGGQWAFRYS